MGYPEGLHPPMAKLTYFEHYTSSGRETLAQLQHEQISLLEGFEEKRRGFEGEWRSYNATLSR